MKKKLIIVVLVLVVVGVVGGFMLKSQKDSSAKNSNEVQMEKLAQLYYEEYLYDILITGKSDEDKAQFLSNYKDKGLKVSIESIEKVSELDSSKIVKKIGNSCDKKSESITIIPNDPYTKKDYKVKAKCK